MRFTKPIAAALALSVAALSFTGAAQAKNRYHNYHHNNGGSAVAAGIFGFAAGALVSGALSQPRYYCGNGYYSQPCRAPAYYYGPPPVVYQPAPVYRAAPVYYDRPQPWTPEWFAYCDERYKSFNARTGYFYGFDHQYHFCQ